MNNRTRLSPGDPSSSRESHRQRIVDFWRALDADGDPGKASPEVLALRDLVTECLGHDPPNIDRADSLTAEAALRIQGWTEN